MNNKIETNTREEWLTKAARMIRAELVDQLTDLTTDRDIKISIAPMRSKRLGECWPSSRSPVDHKNEIFISAHNDDSMVVLETTTHELLHAYDDCKSGHKGAFARAARAIGLEGKLTATHAGEKLKNTLGEYVELLGDIPHSALTHANKDKGRNNNKLVCDDCGFKANLSAKWANQTGDGFQCPVCFRHTTRTITS
jgi:hypothetical protein